MFKIYDGREYFYQWDLDRKLIVEDAAITQVHFCNRTDNCSLVCETFVEDGLTLVNVPNILLQTDWKIHVYAYDGKHTKHDESYEVKSRTKPSDYVYTETEVLNYEALEERIAALEENSSNPVIVEQTFNPESENAQSGVAVAEAVVDKADNIATITGYDEYGADPISITNTLANLIQYTFSEARGNSIYLYRVIEPAIEEKADKSELESMQENISLSLDGLYVNKADKTTIANYAPNNTFTYYFEGCYNCDLRLGVRNSISFVFGNGAYYEDYTSGLSFDSGATPTSINYTGSGILNWVGTDCTTVNGLSIFQPSANTHYDIVFYYNGKQFIGLVNGFVPATGNVVS